jgi:hypothetical protein
MSLPILRTPSGPQAAGQLSEGLQSRSWEQADFLMPLEELLVLLGELLERLVSSALHLYRERWHWGTTPLHCESLISQSLDAARKRTHDQMMAWLQSSRVVSDPTSHQRSVTCTSSGGGLSAPRLDFHIELWVVLGQISTQTRQHFHRRGLWHLVAEMIRHRSNVHFPQMEEPNNVRGKIHISEVGVVAGRPVLRGHEETASSSCIRWVGA